LGQVGLLLRLRGQAAPPFVRHERRVPVSYELTTPANVAEVRLVEELLAEAWCLGDGVARESLGDLAYTAARRSRGLWGQARRRRRAGNREGRPAGPEAAHIEVCFATLKRDFGLEGTLAKTLVGLATRIAAKIAAYTYGCYINRLLGRPQGRIKDLWA